MRFLKDLWRWFWTGTAGRAAEAAPSPVTSTVSAAAPAAAPGKSKVRNGPLEFEAVEGSDRASILGELRASQTPLLWGRQARQMILEELRKLAPPRRKAKSRR